MVCVVRACVCARMIACAWGMCACVCPCVCMCVSLVLRFLPELKTRLRSFNEKTQLGDLFLTHLPYFKAVYTQYVSNYSNGTLYIPTDTDKAHRHNTHKTTSHASPPPCFSALRLMQLWRLCVSCGR